MAITDPTKLVIAVPENRIDQIIDIKEGSFSVGAGSTDAFNEVTPATAEDTASTWQGALFLFKGIWSHDGGASWHEFNNSVILGDYANGLRTLTVNCELGGTGGIDSNGGGAYFVDASNYGSSGYTILYKILFLARPDQQNIPTNKLIQALRYSSKYRYMKIFLDSSFNAPTSGATPIAHNLGYVPNVSAWGLYSINSANGGGYNFLPMGGGDHGGGFGADQSNTIDTSNITFRVINPAPTFYDFVRIYYRVYLDA